jgi:hypothetical protein
LQRASRDRDAGAWGEPPPHRLDLRVVVEARRAEGPAWRILAGIENGELDGVVEHPPAVAIDKGLGRGSLGHNHIVAVEFDVEVRDPLDRLALHD